MTNDFNWMTFKARELVIDRRSPPPKEQWVEAIGGFDQSLDSSAFWRGDLYLKGVEWYGDDFASSVFDPLTSSVKTWQNNASICKRVPPRSRRGNLSYSHHAEVAYVEPENYPPESEFSRMTSIHIKDHYLQLAIDEFLSARQLRDRIKNDNPNSTSVLVMKRLQKVEELLLGLIDDVSGDVQKNVRMMHRLCMDAIEIERDNE